MLFTTPCNSCESCKAPCEAVFTAVSMYLFASSKRVPKVPYALLNRVYFASTSACSPGDAMPSSAAVAIAASRSAAAVSKALFAACKFDFAVPPSSGLPYISA